MTLWPLLCWYIVQITVQCKSGIIAPSSVLRRMSLLHKAHSGRVLFWIWKPCLCFIETCANCEVWTERAQIVYNKKHSAVLSLWPKKKKKKYEGGLYRTGRDERFLESSQSSKEKPKTSCHCMKRIARRPVGIGLLGASPNKLTVQRLFSALENMKGMFKNLKARSVPVLWSGRGKQIFTSP